MRTHVVSAGREGQPKLVVWRLSATARGCVKTQKQEIFMGRVTIPCIGKIA